MASYTVKTGDSLSEIAKRNGTTVAELLRLNPKLSSDPKYKDGKVIFNGTKITLPSREVAPPPVPKTTTPPPSAATGTPPATIPTLTFAPSALAAGESGAIGAASIASQMQAAAAATPPPLPGPLVSATAEEPVPTLNAPAIFQPTEMPTLPPVVEQPTQSQTMPNVFIDTTATTNNTAARETQDLIDPRTGAKILDKDGNPIQVKIGGTREAYYDYLAGLARSQRNLQAAGAANKLAIDRAAATGEASKRTAERDIYRSQQRALNELSRRGLAGAPGLTRAAQRAYGSGPLSQRLEAIRKMQGDITAANLLLAQQQSAEKAAEEQRQFDLTKATGIANQLGGQ